MRKEEEEKREKRRGGEASLFIPQMRIDDSSSCSSLVHLGRISLLLAELSLSLSLSLVSLFFSVVFPSCVVCCWALLIGLDFLFFLGGQRCAQLKLCSQNLFHRVPERFRCVRFSAQFVSVCVSGARANTLSNNNQSGRVIF